MSRYQKFWSWIVLLFGAGAYVPLAVGSWNHPAELNVASYGLWFILTLMLLYSSWKQNFAGLRLLAGFCLGNFSMLILAFLVGGYTFNLGPAEAVVLYGMIATLSIWGAVGQVTGKWNPRILFTGGVAADILSFYPQLKQYLTPHDVPTTWMILGWSMWIAGALINVIMVEHLATKLCMSEVMYENRYQKQKSSLLIFEESAFSLENSLCMVITILVMTW